MKEASQNISLMSDPKWEDFRVYRAECACGGESCRQELMLDVEKDLGILNLSIEMKTYFSELWYGDQSWIIRMWNRIKIASKVLFIGQASMSANFMFNGENAIEDYIKALQQGLELVKKAKESYEKSKEIN